MYWPTSLNTALGPIVGGVQRFIFRNRDLVNNIGGTQVDAAIMTMTNQELLAILDAAQIAPDPANNAQVIAAIEALIAAGGTGRELGVQTLTANGAINPVIGAMSYRVEAQGAGASGGGAVAATASTLSVCGGGGAGTFVRVKLTAAQFGAQPVPCIIGLGGATVTGGDGSAGSGPTVFGGILSVPPGMGGKSPGDTTAGTAGGGPGGGAATVNVGTIEDHILGQTGSFGIASNTTSGVSGGGANSPCGTGGSSVSLAVGAGVAGTGYGSGGSGSVAGPSGAATASGAGTGGRIRVWAYS